MHRFYLAGLLLPGALAQYGYGGGGGYGSGSGSSSSSSSAPATTQTSSAPQQSGVHVVQVAQSGLTFTPDSLAVPVGDKVSFVFNPANHSVVKSTFDQPCQPDTSNPIFSGFQVVASGKQGANTFDVTVNDTNPIWIYCAQARHCQSGMVMVINPASNSQDNIDNFKKAAASQTTNLPGASVAGGVFVALNAASPSATTSSKNAAWMPRATDMSNLVMAGGAALAMAVL